MDKILEERVLNRLSKIVDDIAQIKENVASLDGTTRVQTVILQDHTRRSLANEELVRLTNERFEHHKDHMEQKLADQLAPVIDHLQGIKATLRIFRSIGLVGGFIFGCFEIYTYFVQ